MRKSERLNLEPSARVLDRRPMRSRASKEESVHGVGRWSYEHLLESELHVDIYLRHSALSAQPSTEQLPHPNRVPLNSWGVALNLKAILKEAWMTFFSPMSRLCTIEGFDVTAALTERKKPIQVPIFL